MPRKLCNILSIGGNVMKKIVTSVIVVLSALTACTVQNQGQSYDEVYYSPNDKAAIVQAKPQQLHKSVKELVVKSDTSVLKGAYVGNVNSNIQNTNALVNDSSYVIDNNGDNPYDYSYASRIRRFQYGFFNDYYNDFYTNRYWYDYNPMYFGSSIYNMWGMSPGLSFYMDPFALNYGLYSPFSPFYNSYFYPYMFGMYGMYPFDRGLYGGSYAYGNGSGYGYGGYNNSLDRNSSVYYGPRRTLSASNGPTPSERSAFTQRYSGLTNGGGIAALRSVSAPGNGRESMNGSGTIGNSGLKVANANSTNVTGIDQRQPVRGNRNLFRPSNLNGQTIAAPRQVMNQNNVNRNVNTQGVQQQQQMRRPNTGVVQQPNSYYNNPRTINGPNTSAAPQRYAKPQQVVTPQQYYNPVNARPRSSNEYTSPQYRSPAGYNSNQAAPQRSVSDPQRYAPPRVYQSTPTTTSGARREVSSSYYRSSPTSTPSTYSEPTRSSYSAPAQTYSAPTQSYSAPTQTYSAPSGGNSRESGSGSSSSGSSSTGPRR